MKIPMRKTHAVIDLDAIEQNIRTLWKRAGEGKKFIVLLKADSYGHGSPAVAKIAEELDVFAGGVAALEEVEYLRNRGVEMPLLLLEDLFFDEIAPALERNVKLSVSSLEYAHEIEKIAAQMRMEAVVHINVDTGMGRLGVQLPRALAMIEEVSSFEHI
jgi:alanine racemase